MVIKICGCVPEMSLGDGLKLLDEGFRERWWLWRGGGEEAMVVVVVVGDTSGTSRKWRMDGMVGQESEDCRQSN